MKALSTRDKWLAAALPAMITLLIGWVFFLRPASRDLNLIRQRVENQGSLNDRRALVAQAQLEKSDLEKDLAEKRRQPGQSTGVFDRNWAMQQVSLLCAAHNLNLNSIKLEPAGKLPPALQESIKALTSNPASTPPQVWKIDLSGTYPNVLKMLEGLKKATPLIVPLNLSMQSDKAGRPVASWVLTLWL